ncbi:unnamed protein product [Arctogadus glacialis]
MKETANWIRGEEQILVKFVTWVHLCSVGFLSLVPQSGSSWFVVELGFRQCSFMRREQKAFFYPFLSSYSPSSRSSLGGIDA